MKKGLMKKIIATAVLGIMTMGLAGCGSSNDKNSASKTDLLEKIQKNGKLVVGMSADYAPYEFHYIDENGKDVIGGFDVDIANEIANKIGVNLVIQEMDFDALVSALPAGKVDLLELKAGKVDAIVMEKPVAEMAVKSNPELAVGKPIYEEQTGGNAVGIAKNNPQLLAKVNEVITELNESGKMDEYIEKANELAATANIVEE